MSLFRELHVLLRLFVFCGLIPYVPPAPRDSVRRRRTQRYYLIRVGVTLLLFGVVSYVRVSLLNGYSLFMYSLSYIVWLLATVVDTIGIAVLLIANAVNTARFGLLVEILERVERTIDGWTLGRSGRSNPSYPPYGRQAAIALGVCLAYNIFIVFRNINTSVHVILQVRVEEWITDMYLFYVIFLLLALGRCAKRLRSMLQDTVQYGVSAELCAVIRLRDDLLRCVALVNRLYGHVFLGISASWVVSITCIVYFDFILGGLQFNINQPFVMEHGIMLAWRSMLVGGLVAVAGSVAERV